MGVVQWRAAIFNSGRLSSRAKLVAYTLSMFMGTDDGYAFPGGTLLATRAGYGRGNRKSVVKALRELRRAGYLRSRRQKLNARDFIYHHYAALPGDRAPSRTHNHPGF